MGVQPKCHVRNPCQGRHGDQKTHRCDPKGPGAKAPRSGMYNAQQSPSFQASNDVFRYTNEELCSIAVQYATGKEVVDLLPVPGSREVILGSVKVVPYDDAVQDAKKGAKSGNKRHKQRPQWVMIATDYDDDNDEKTDGSDLGHVMTATRSGKRQVQPPTDHFERLVMVACPNHVYPIKHKLKDCDMIKNFMTSESLTWGMKL
jgi:hypothetical protein